MLASGIVTARILQCPPPRQTPCPNLGHEMAGLEGSELNGPDVYEKRDLHLIILHANSSVIPARQCLAYDRSEMAHALAVLTPTIEMSEAAKHGNNAASTYQHRCNRATVYKLQDAARPHNLGHLLECRGQLRL